MKDNFWFSLLTWAVALFAIALAGLTAYRVHRSYSPPSQTFNWSLRGHSDFHNTHAYSQAFRDGVSPYSLAAAEKYEMTRPAPPYAPLVFLVHLPFTWFSIHWADTLFFIYNVGLLASLAAIAVRWNQLSFPWLSFWAVLSLLLLSRPGHMTLFTGYFTLEMVLGTAFAIRLARTRPSVAGIGLVFAAIKPTYILPLGILMVFRRDFAAVAWGALFFFVLNLAAFSWLATQSSPNQIVKEFVDVQQVHHADETEAPVNTWTRVDILGMVAKGLAWKPDDKVYLLGMIVLLLFPGWLVWRLSYFGDDEGAQTLSHWLIILSMLLTIYHHSYDCLLLVVPWIGLVSRVQQRNFKGVSAGVCWGIILLVGIVASNYLASKTALDLIDPGRGLVWQSLTLISGGCLCFAFAAICLSSNRFLRSKSIR